MRTCFVNEREDDAPILYAELQLAAARHPALRRKLRSMFDRHLEDCLVSVVGLSLPSESFRIAFVTMFAVIEGLALQRAGGNATVEIAKAAKAIVFDAVSTILPAGRRRICACRLFVAPTRWVRSNSITATIRIRRATSWSKRASTKKRYGVRRAQCQTRCGRIPAYQSSLPLAGLGP